MKRVDHDERSDRRRAERKLARIAAYVHARARCDVRGDEVRSKLLEEPRARADFHEWAEPGYRVEEPPEPAVIDAAEIGPRCPDVAMPGEGLGVVDVRARHG